MRKIIIPVMPFVNLPTFGTLGKNGVFIVARLASEYSESNYSANIRL